MAGGSNLLLMLLDHISILSYSWPLALRFIFHLGAAIQAFLPEVDLLCTTSVLSRWTFYFIDQQCKSPITYSWSDGSGLYMGFSNGQPRFALCTYLLTVSMAIGFGICPCFR